MRRKILAKQCIYYRRDYGSDWRDKSKASTPRENKKFFKKIETKLYKNIVWAQ